MTDATPSENRSPFNTWYVWAGILLVVIVVAAIVVAVSTSGHDTKPSSGPTTSQPIADSDSVCGLPAGDQSIPTTAAPTTKWVLVGTVAAPDAPKTIGPGKLVDGLRTCFAHSPVGALYATANFYAQASSPSLAAAALHYFVVPGPGRDAAEAVDKASPPAGASGIQLVGFQVRQYQGNSAIVDVVVRNSNGALVSFVTSLSWVAGDWRIDVQNNGQPPVAPAQVNNLSGYLPWSGA